MIRIKSQRFFFILKALFLLVVFLGEGLSVGVAATDNDFSNTSNNRNNDSPYVVGTGNVIQIKIFGDAATHQIYRVDESGLINHALIGKIQVAGYTVSEIEAMIEKKLDRDYILNPRVNVFVLQYSTFSIIGEVRRPGNYEITGHVSVIEAISMAGGFSAVANQRGVKIMRKKDGSESTIDVDTTRVTQHGDRSAEVTIEQNDVVVVPKSFF